MFHVEQIFPREEEKRVAKIVAIANQKGGVGKTTTAVNLSSCVAALGKKVLIVDLDPQGNTTTGYGIPKRSVEAGTYEVLIGKATAAQAIRHTEYRTDVIGSNTRLAGASLEMIDLPGREGRLRKALAEVQKYFGSKVYKTTIPRSIRISEAPSYGQPINFYEPKGKGSEAYMDLAIEFVKHNRPQEPKKSRAKAAPAAEPAKNALED